MDLKEKNNEKTKITRTGSGLDPDPVLDTEPVTLPQAPRSYAMSQTRSSVRYKECQKNHAASSGGHVVDGCGEFMSSGEEDTAESFICAACDCHRSFHRKETNGMFLVKVNNTNFVSNSQRPIVNRHVSPIMMSFGGGGRGGGAAESSTEDLNKFGETLSGINGKFQEYNNNNYNGKKRFRTKFNEKQKEKMLELANKIGWRMSKEEDEVINRFCNEINVKRQVFKVWMHNNKQASSKKK
ncbi:unnamed protein product [Cochlearia groenlandica]